MSYSVVISGTGLWTPDQTITNDELVESFNEYVKRYNARNAQAIEAGELEALGPSNSAFIEKASGIKQRYVIDKTGVLDPDRLAPRIDERTDDEVSIQAEIAVTAAKQALDNAGLKANDLDAVLVACSNMQRPYPAMAVEVQAALGMDHGWGYDMNVACSSATFGIQAGVDAIRNGSARRVLMVNPEICSAHLAWEDRDCHFIFGDVATAVILERKEDAVSSNQWEILGTRLQTKFSSNIRNNFGFLNRTDERGVGARDKLFRQEGRKVFREVCPMVAEQISSHLKDTQIPVESVNRMWLHQANLAMNELISKRVLGRPATREEAPVILDAYANTSSAGSIIAFHKHNEDLPVDTKGVICSFGAGYSIGSVIVNRIK
ncbi:MAG: 3-oxoacyl-ACP synthase [Alcanivorax borkumensis]|uniref:3-oxoacyl-[acyl-carrier-protein] synthase n=1 Tax=Alcanivorax borkumensis (strain ATCC 700651 / DSM 11573 / NCIMB 13689 / SK2) TaxID=393595 RepID=Q0VPD0_ALCBS|nr:MULTISPECIES: beta-ketoacyl-ACP synthase III [Alcanivorax]OJH06653.1 MAG: 3-oxoacyl-ACP synthase [Alcanivorax borkumensis]EUC70420.1 3-oxoacyl-ACP synthase [Alcanivorax sp. 97CO-5]PKG02085.1 beta-ketoacyl-ACP synthase III [Alcanivorax sp. 97CO-6]CAL16968.1 3-oxoacyl-[acyl-carrier-protein] synthase [Alcanivorax borkumensis SK2]BAP14422.1 3-oxoacyl-(acyl carrier protein) synthase III [Alcanivorax sp. NBRC 101098]